ncbi:MAG: hypothetical protein IPJ81_16390 [Chitinophagaceae bacterium]|nr:hypothetical protein [Chitinophagaceae bacterium]
MKKIFLIILTIFASQLSFSQVYIYGPNYADPNQVVKYSVLFDIPVDPFSVSWHIAGGVFLNIDPIGALDEDQPYDITDLPPNESFPGYVQKFDITIQWGAGPYGSFDVYDMNSVQSGGYNVTIGTPPLLGGNISSNINYFNNQNKPVISTFVTASGGACNGAYVYTWEYTIGNNIWQAFGNGKDFPVNPFNYTDNTSFRRKAKCANDSAYSNCLFITYLSPFDEDKNYVRVNDILIPGVKGLPQADVLPTGDKIQTTTYYDGLSRPIQTISKETSELQPNVWGDMTSFVEYDAAGRSTKSFIPYPTTSTVGKYKENAKTEQQAFVSSTYGEAINMPTYSSITFDNSPLNMPVNAKAPGAGWGGNAAYLGDSYQYEFNTVAEDIKIWKIDFLDNSIPAINGVYPTGKLYKSILTDDKGKKVYEYKDFSGNIILKKVQLSDVVADNSYDGWLCTYYVYDDLDQLRSTITPKAVTYLRQHAWAFANLDVYNELCFYNHHDERGRTIVKHSAGAGEVHLVYDKRDRLVLSQDENQRKRTIKQWSFYLYDKENRQIVSGLLNNNTVDRIQYQNYANTLNNDDIQLTLYTGQNENIIAHNPVAGKAGLGLNYTNLIINTVSHYDNYNYTGVKPFNASFSFAPTNNLYVQPTQKTLRVYGMVTGSKVRVIDSKYDDNLPANDQFITTTAYFDEKGRPLQGLTGNIKGGTDYATMQYDYAGKTLSICEKQNFTGTSFIDFATISKFEYNKIGQVTTLSKKYHTQAYKKIVSYTYDPMGRIKIKKLSPDFNAGAGIESLQYDYNVNGLLTGINKDYALSNSSLAQWDHYFGMYLGYDNKDAKFAAAQFNGNLTGIIWKGQGDNNPRKYNYVYDNASRLMAANFMQKEKPTDALWANSTADFSMLGVQYDENGNLLFMQQKGIIPGVNTPILIDKLTYTYQTISDGKWSNKLEGIVDNTPNLNQSNNGLSGDFKDETYNVGGLDYKYDHNGNMVRDNNKKIRIGANNGIEYNFMDKPQKITIEGKSITEFIYDATGSTLGKKITNTLNNQITTTWYNGDFVYEEIAVNQIKLQYINHEEGRIRVFTPVVQPRVVLGNNFDLPGGQKAVFEFFVKDNLQNVRTVLSEETHLEHHNATMEIADANVKFYEEATFGKSGANNMPLPGNEVVATRITKADDPIAKDWASAGGIKVSKLTAAANAVGPNMMLKVMAGDKLHLNVDYYYNQPVNNGNNSILSQITTALTSLIGNGVQSSTAIKGSSTVIGTNLNNIGSPLGQFLQTQNNNTVTTPRAYLNYIFFDENFKFVPYDAVTGLGSYSAAVAQPGNGKHIQVSNVKAPKNGYAFVYLSNSSNINVYFDNLDIVHERGRLVEENTYYPYGLKIKSISGKAFGKLENKKGYQGDYSEEDAETGWNEFDLRMYNAQIGRWNSTDPYEQYASPYLAMSNDPANHIDPDGGFTGWIGTAVGAATFGTAAYLIAKNNGISGAGLAGITVGATALGAGVGYAVNMAQFSDQYGNFGAHFRAFYEGVFGGNKDYVDTRFNGDNNRLNQYTTQVDVPNIWGSGGGGNTGNPIDVVSTNPTPQIPTANIKRILSGIEPTIQVTRELTMPSLAKRFSPNAPSRRVIKKTKVQNIPFSFCADSPMSASYSSPTVSDEQFAAVGMLERQVRKLMQPGDKISSGTLTQTADLRGNVDGSSFIPNTGGAYENFNPVTGRRVDGSWRNGLQQRAINSVGNTLAQNYSSQTSGMAKMLSRRLGANISAAYNYADPGSCRYRFRGNIQRTIVTWKWK